MTAYRVCIVPEYPHSLMKGGMQGQAEDICQALLALGVKAETFNWTSVTQADVYHFVGFPPYLSTLALLAKQAGKPYVCTILCGGYRSSLKLLMASLRHRLNAALPGRQHYRKAILGADTIITITQADKSVARFVFGIPASRIVVIEHGVDKRFQSADPLLWQNQYGKNPFVLCVGHIQRRKNQLFLLQAANQLRIPVVLIGSVLPGEYDYAKLVTAEAQTNAVHGGMWLRDLSPDAPLLASAYAACRSFALLSLSETQPLSVLEAMAAGKPILLGKAPYTKEAPFTALPTTSATSMNHTIRDLDALWNHGAATTLPSAFSWEQVALKLCSVYNQTIPAPFRHEENH